MQDQISTASPELVGSLVRHATGLQKKVAFGHLLAPWIR